MIRWVRWQWCTNQCVYLLEKTRIFVTYLKIATKKNAVDQNVINSICDEVIIDFLSKW